ncbi:uncharacterized protein KQ657_004960 [Scheffersomyces spartinae]|uniref:Vacuolar sorting protein Vps3844 C-terminal domain-containing protein n=1 Tax=Scheffersomyces spartinae TaxID=45513 RepID=A0A9P7VAJ7_9ASCO|nr:uncharacterized protein KQ657_004960 [Scheffersomyces spartinae]KAG7194240.1 hypothetical protein KQ657_004960 [Scheffersomyces spartinae]
MKVSDIVLAAFPVLAVATNVWSPEPTDKREAKFSVLEDYLDYVLQINTEQTPPDWKFTSELQREFGDKWNHLIVTMDDYPSFDQSKLLSRSHQEDVDEHKLEAIIQSSSWKSMTPSLKSAHNKYLLKFSGFDNRLQTIWNYASNSPKVMWSNNDYDWVENIPIVVDELSQLVRITETVSKASNPREGESFVFHSQALRLISEKYGRNSDELKQLEVDLKNLLEKLTHKFNVYLVNIAPKHTVEEISKRNEQLETVFKRVEDTSCFSSEEACQVSTSNCNNHGVCTMSKSKGCWSCLCSPTVDKKKGTVSWAGYDCSKKDVSFQANLFIWTGIAATLVIAGGVSFLFSLGSEPLPGVLDAMTKKST